MNRRDEALKAVAEDAAAAGQADIVTQAIDNFYSMNVKDDAATACALKLSAVGKQQAAVDVANMMHNLNKRDEVLNRIATAKP